MREEIAIITAEQMENLIYVIRGQKVMLDVDLAKIYGYETKSFNQQVKRNIEKFDDDFMFQLTQQELVDLRSQNVTANLNSMSRSLPYAFTEQGIYMLMTVLKGELAAKRGCNPAASDFDIKLIPASSEKNAGISCKFIELCEWS